MSAGAMSAGADVSGRGELGGASGVLHSEYCELGGVSGAVHSC